MKSIFLLIIHLIHATISAQINDGYVDRLRTIRHNFEKTGRIGRSDISFAQTQLDSTSSARRVSAGFLLAALAEKKLVSAETLANQLLRKSANVPPYEAKLYVQFSQKCLSVVALDPFAHRDLVLVMRHSAQNEIPSQEASAMKKIAVNNRGSDFLELCIAAGSKKGLNAIQRKWLLHLLSFPKQPYKYALGKHVLFVRKMIMIRNP